jgi:hypothetical protein
LVSRHTSFRQLQRATYIVTPLAGPFSAANIAAEMGLPQSGHGMDFTSFTKVQHEHRADQLEAGRVQLGHEHGPGAVVGE